MTKAEFSRFSIFILLAFAVPLAALGADLKKENWFNLDCFINRNLKSCSAVISSDGSRAADQYNLKFACVELKDSRSCTRFGDWLNKRGIADAQTYYDQACEAKDMDGCRRKINSLSESLKPEMTSAQIEERKKSIEVTYGKICAPPAASSECKSLRASIQGAEQKTTFKPCALRIWSVTRDGDNLAVSEKTGPLSSAEACAKECARLEARPNFADFDARAMRTQCLHDGHELGPSHLQTAPRKEACRTDRQRIELKAREVDFVDPCQCEDYVPRNLNTQIEKLGAFAVGSVGASKKVGARRWAHCALHVYPIAKEALGSPDWKTRLGQVKSAITSSPEVGDRELNFASIEGKHD